MDDNFISGHHARVKMQFDMNLAMEFRRQGSDLWLAGYTERIGASNVLFRAVDWIEPQSRIEMIFRMPVSDSCDLVCAGTVLRVDLPSAAGAMPVISATIDRYSFVRV
jgi:hypothetical protein